MKLDFTREGKIARETNSCQKPGGARKEEWIINATERGIIKSNWNVEVQH